MDDSSLDDVSNMDVQDFPGQQLASLQQPQKGTVGDILDQNVQGENDDLLLSQSYEAEKEVPQEEDSLVGPEVSNQIMLMVQIFLGRTRKAAKVDDLVLEFLRPKNMPFLKSPKIEEDIFLDLAGPARKFDKNCRELQSFMNAGMTALMRCIQSLIKLEKLHPLITQAGLQAKKALQLMAFTNKEINNRRKDALRTAVNPEYLPLLNHAKPPSEDWLLGGTLNDAIKQCDESKKLAEKLMKNRKGVPQSEDMQQSVPQNNNFQYRQRYRNRGAKREHRNYNQSGNTNRNHWVAPAQIVQPQPNPPHQNYQWVQQQQQPAYGQQQFWQQHLPQHHYQQQQSQVYPQQTQVQQNLGFHQAAQRRNYPQQNQGYTQQKRRN